MFVFVKLLKMKVDLPSHVGSINILNFQLEIIRTFDASKSMLQYNAPITDALPHHNLRSCPKGI